MKSIYSQVDFYSKKGDGRGNLKSTGNKRSNCGVSTDITIIDWAVIFWGIKNVSELFHDCLQIYEDCGREMNLGFFGRDLSLAEAARKVSGGRPDMLEGKIREAGGACAWRR